MAHVFAQDVGCGSVLWLANTGCFFKNGGCRWAQMALLVDDWFGDLQYMGLHGIIYIIIYTYYPIYIYTILYIYYPIYIYILGIIVIMGILIKTLLDWLRWALIWHMGYHQKGLCKGYVLEWNIAQNLQKRRWPFKTKANLTTNVCW